MHATDCPCYNLCMLQSFVHATDCFVHATLKVVHATLVLFELKGPYQRPMLWSMVQVSVNRTGPRTKAMVQGPMPKSHKSGPQTLPTGPMA